jgi:phosphatidylethanolamine/phosphatidyl-N-methylethanolamine N-methyltransferase
MIPVSKRMKVRLPWWVRVCAKRECVTFFLRWLAAPLRIGSVAPSSKYLARAIANEIDLNSALPVIELGGGTGSVTQALLETGMDPQRLVVVECDTHLCTMLRHRFPHVRIVQGDASKLIELLEPFGIDAVSAVVSGLPLLSLPRQSRDTIIRQSLWLLGSNGRFIQFTYGLGSPLADSNVYGELTARIWLNFPPASVWNFQQL